MNDIPLHLRVELLEAEVRELHQRLQVLSTAHHGPPPLPAESEECAKLSTRESATVVSIGDAMEPATAEEIEPLAAPPIVSQQSLAPIIAPLEPSAQVVDTELRIGQVWPVRIGVLLLFTGFVLLANYAWEHYISQLGALPRLIMLTVLATGGVIVGEIMRRRPNLGTFGEVITAGGLAALYYCAFAAHHVARLRVIDSDGLGATLLTVTGLAILGYGVWRRASLMCSFALLLSFYGTTTQPVVLPAMISALIVAVAGALISIRYRWKSLGVVGVLGAYASFIVWQGMAYHTEAFSLGAWFLCAYWILFGSVALHPRSVWSENQGIVVTVCNQALLAALLPFDWTTFSWDDRCWMVYAVLGAVNIVGSFALQIKQGRTRMVESLLLQGVAFITLASLTKFSGHQLFFVIGVKALFLLLWDRWNERRSVELSGYGLVLLALLLASGSVEKKLDPQIWSLFALLIFSCLCVTRAVVMPQRDEISARLAMRWLMAVSSLSILYWFLLSRLPEGAGALTMIAISLFLSCCGRLLGEKFPAKEAISVAVYGAVLASIGLCRSVYTLDPGVMPWAILLCFLHALTHHQQWHGKMLLSARESQGLLLSLSAWLLVGVYGTCLEPAGSATALYATLLLLLIHFLAHWKKLTILALVSPLFALFVHVMAYPLYMQEHPLSLVVCGLLLGYAVWLQVAKPLHPLVSIPLWSTAFALSFYFVSYFSHASLYLAALAIVVAVSPLRDIITWRNVARFWSIYGFVFYLTEKHDQLASYLFPLVGFAALAFRARVRQLPSTSATKIISLLLIATLSYKASLWVDAQGSGHALTILWALLAAGSFGLGFAVKEPVLRLAMLILLLLCVFKVLLSVWMLGTLMRIASFLITGLIFLLLGYIYNKYPEWFGKSTPTV